MSSKKDDSSQIEKRLMLQERKEERFMRNITATSHSTQALIGDAGKSVFFNDTQRKEAELVHMLPKDFPIDHWEKLPTKAQLITMRHSGLDDRDQWTLLNASTPLGTLSVLKNIQDGLAANTISPHKATSLSVTANRLVTEQKRLNSGDASTLPPLQKSLMRRELEKRLDDLKSGTDRITTIAPKPASISVRTPLTQAGVHTGSQARKTLTQTPKPDSSPKPDTGLAGMWGRLKTLVGGLFTPKETETSPLVQTILIAYEPPEKTPPMTPSPTPTSTPKPTPKPAPSERDRRAQAAVAAAVAYADQNIKYTEKGTEPETGFDCSGLIKDVCEGTNIIFKQGYVGKSAQGMVTSFQKHKEYASAVYDYTKDTVFPTLMPGDLVFSAYPETLSETEHVTMATGNDLQVVEASDRVGVKKVTDQFNAYDTINEDGLYIRGTGQVVTYVFRPDY